MGKVFHFYGLNPSVKFTKPGSWRRIDFSQHKERREEGKVLPSFPASNPRLSRESCSDRTGQPAQQSERNTSPRSVEEQSSTGLKLTLTAQKSSEG